MIFITPLRVVRAQVSFGGLGLKVTDEQLLEAARSMMADALAARGVPIHVRARERAQRQHRPVQRQRLHRWTHACRCRMSSWSASGTCLACW